MKRATLMLAALALLLGGVRQARADVTYNFTYNDSPYGNDVGYGTLVTTKATSYAGAMYATSGFLKMTSGLDAGTTFSLLTVVPGTSQPVGELPTSISGFSIVGYPISVYADNLLYPNNDAGSNPNVGGLQPGTVSYLDTDGLIFSSGSLLINLNGEGGPANYLLTDSNGGTSAFSGTFALVTPEPSGIALLGLGVVCLAIGYAVRRRKLALVAA